MAGDVVIKTKRIYEAPSTDDGVRILVDRLWPRGIRKVDAQVDRWLKDIGPSTALRKWFGHDPERWDEFTRRYFKELDQKPAAVNELRSTVAGQKTTLLFGARDTRYNNAVCLREYLESQANDLRTEAERARETAGDPRPKKKVRRE